MLGAPFGDVAMMPREENIGDFHATKFGGLSVLWILEIITIGKAFDFGGSSATEHAGKKTSNRVDNDESW